MGTIENFQGYMDSLVAEAPVEAGSTSATAHQYRLPDHAEVFGSDPALFDGVPTSYNWEIKHGSDIYTVDPEKAPVSDKPNSTVSETGEFLLWDTPIDDLIKSGVLVKQQLPPEPSPLDEWVAANPNGTAPALLDWMEANPDHSEHAGHDHEANPHRR